MKNTIQVRSKGGTRRPSTQTKSSSEWSYDKRNEHPSCLAVFERASMTPVCKIPISDGELWEAITTSAKAKITLKDFIAGAVREKLARVNTMNGAYELDTAISQSNALMQLMLESMELKHYNGNWSEDFADEMNAGIQELVLSTRDRLNTSLDVAFPPNHPKLKVAA